MVPPASSINLPDWVAQLTPSVRAKIFVVKQLIGISQVIDIRNLIIVKEHLIPEMQTRVLVGKIKRSPWWVSSNTNHEFDQAVYELTIIYWDAETNLLFVNSSTENDRLFELVAQSVAAKVQPLPLFDIQKVFADVKNARFVNVGMRHRMIGKHSEAYRMLTGPDAHLAVTRTDARTHVKGHAFGTGEFGNGLTSLGFTDSGKIWSSNKARSLQELINQFKVLAKRIVTANAHMRTNSELDYLSSGEPLQNIPKDIIAAAWSEDVYQRDYTLVNIPLKDWDIQIDRASSNNTQLHIVVKYDTFCVRVLFQAKYPHFSYSINQTPVELDGNYDLVEFLNLHLPRFFASDQSMILGSTIYRPVRGLPLFKLEKLEVDEWIGVDIKREVNASLNGMSIHMYLEQALKASLVDYVIYDHGTGEIADYITVKVDSDIIRVTFYHAKASSGTDPGHRVEDLYEVCGQAVKSVQWLKLPNLFAQILERKKAVFISGTREDFEEFTSHFQNQPKIDEFKIIIVQPGISKAEVNPRMLEILAAADDYVRRVGDADFQAWVSA